MSYTTTTVRLGTVRRALANALNTVSGLSGYTYWPDNCTILPAAMPIPNGTGSPADETFDSQHTLRFEIYILAAWAEAGFEAGQRLLDGFLDEEGSTSVKAALEDDQSLGGLAQAVTVGAFHSYHFNHRMYPDGAPAWGAVLPVEIMVE